MNNRKLIRGNSLISVEDLSKSDYNEIFSRALKFEKIHNTNSCLGKILGTLFFETSTRTKLSFESAMYYLGGSVLPVENMNQTRMKEGESVDDVIKTMGEYCDVLAIRHPQDFSVLNFSKLIKTPIVNAGDGFNEHPTQALLDLFTIFKEFGKIDGLKIALINDLKNARLFHSLALALNNYKVSLKFISNSELKMPLEIKSKLKNKFIETENLEIEDCEVIYIHPLIESWFNEKEQFKRLSGLYRLDEIKLQDSNKHMRYIQQIKNGLFIRMAILDIILNG
jgi:aspartate carbamoyltransferase catalytic subunit